MSVCLCLTKKGIQCKNPRSQKLGDQQDFCKLHQGCDNKIVNQATPKPIAMSNQTSNQLVKFFADNGIPVSTIDQINCQNFSAPIGSFEISF